MEVCLQCHLEPTSGDIPAKLQRFNRGPFSYLPGQPLVDFTIFFDYAPGSGREDRFEGVGGAYRFRQSRCVRESGGKLECGSCHDPHDVPRGADAIRHYSSVCLQCHASAATAHPAGISATPSDCITCHMPKRRAEDGHHMIFTDHRIQRHAPANALADFPEKPGEEYHGAVEPYYPSPLPNTPENNLYRAVAQVGMRNNVAAGMPDLVRLLDAVRPREPEFYMVLGEGWKALGNPAEAATAYRHALELQPDSARAMRALASVDPDHAEEILAKAVQAAPNDAESWFRYGVQTKSAERIQRAIDLNPWFPNQSRRLAELTRSVSALGDALRTDPFDDAAWDLGGQIMAEKGNFPAAFFDFEKALRIHPSGQYLFDYALALARANRFEDAEARALMALQSDAGIAEAHELLGGLHSRKNELPDAAREYEAALALEPELARVRLRLGLVRAAQGDRTRAREQLSEAAKSRDPEIARQANQALRQLGAR
jgi:tetratricopeptide (TPR) repeat protein